MASEQLTQTIKNILGLARSRNFDEAYGAFSKLFSDPVFATYRPVDQRQALSLMIFAKWSQRSPTPLMVEAHLAAIVPLTALASTNQTPADHEMLGICYVITGDEKTADGIFRAGLAIERAQNPQSDLCGSFMKRISQL